MKADPKGVLTGAHFLDGDHAACEGALAAGCRFAAGYPITPSTEVVERICARFPEVGGMFIQMEDELASSIAVIGASWAGKKALTVTSGPGFSLMMEHIGLAVMMEVPVVFIDVQRGGPSTGLPTLTAQADMMQARWGSHGDYEIIALSPSSPQECFELCVRAFNLSERFRCPVFLMMDECVGHMTEKVVIPRPEEIEVEERRYTSADPDSYMPYAAGSDLVPDFAKAGDGYHFHTTGLTHDERGYPVINAEAQNRLVRRLVDKIRKRAGEIADFEETDTEGADVVVLSYGITSRVALRGIKLARAKGIKVGHLRLRTVWPFPEERIQALGRKVGKFVFPELNLGQVVLEAQRLVGIDRVVPVPHAGGSVHDPEAIAAAIEEAAK